MKKPLPVNEHFEILRPSENLIQKILRKIIGMLALVIPVELIQQYLNELRWGFKSLHKRLSKNIYDLIVVEDIYFLPFAVQIAGNAKIMFDAREYYPEELGHSFFWRFTERPMRMRICKKYLRRCDLVMTVSEGLVARYEKEFGVRPMLLRNMPVYHDLKPLAVDSGRIKLVHHGVANRDRCLENMIEIMAQLDERFELDFYLVGDQAYIQALQALAKNNPKIRFPEPVSLDGIIPMLNDYDLGFCYFPPTTINILYGLPNKLFECIQGRIGLLIGPSPNMMPFVRDYGCGFITPAFDVAQTVAVMNSITQEQLQLVKQASDKAAPILCYEKESIEMLCRVKNLLGVA